MVLVNIGDQPCRVEKGGRIAPLIIEKIDKRELQEVAELDDTEREDQGFGSSDTTMDQRVTGQKAKTQMEINKISARAFGQFYCTGETTSILSWDVIEDEIQLEAMNISTEMVIENKTNNQDQDASDAVPQEYHHLLHMFEKGEMNTIPLHQPGVHVGIDLEEGKTVAIKKIHAISSDQLGKHN